MFHPFSFHTVSAQVCSLFSAGKTTVIHRMHVVYIIYMYLQHSLVYTYMYMCANVPYYSDNRETWNLMESQCLDKVHVSTTPQGPLCGENLVPMVSMPSISSSTKVNRELC